MNWIRDEYKLFRITPAERLARRPHALLLIRAKIFGLAGRLRAKIGVLLKGEV